MGATNRFSQDVLLSCGHLIHGEWLTAATEGMGLYCEECDESRRVEIVELLGVSLDRGGD